MWAIRWRAWDGVRITEMDAATMEEAEFLFYDDLAVREEFGVIISTKPLELV